jgi:hypothetical protein
MEHFYRKKEFTKPDISQNVHVENGKKYGRIFLIFPQDGATRPRGW